LEARAYTQEQSSSARLTLTPREETPGAPELSASFRQTSVLAGDSVEYVIRVNDATDHPLSNVTVRTWTGPRGTRPPKDENEWLKVSKRWVTNAAGEVTGSVDTPATVAPGAGTSMQLVVRTKVDGHDLEKEASVAVGRGSAKAEILPEAKSIVPGVLQHVLLRVRDGHRGPVGARFAVVGDGLQAEVRTDTFGEADVIWNAPPDLGATRSSGPCAGGVAANVRVRPLVNVAGLAPRNDPFDLCVSVDREADALVRLDRTAARIGDRVHVQVIAAPPSDAADRTSERGPWSIVAASPNGVSTRSIWVEDGPKGGDIELPEGEPGIWSIGAALPSGKNRARVASAPLLVAPRTLPKLQAFVTGGRAAPGGAVEVDASLTDEHGQPLVGSIAAVMIDKGGGGSTAGIEALDTRRALCRPFNVERDRCDALVEGDLALDAARRGDLGSSMEPPVRPLVDPGANAREQLTRSFADVLLSLEGAVFQATATPDQLRDARRKVGGVWQFNPELMTLVTAEMNEPPQTPGGEPLVLSDLLAVDSQVTFDNVARRVTRLKLFNILSAVRTFRNEHSFDADEPALQNPNALLRRLVREDRLSTDALLDPWGGTIQFAKSDAPPLPFLSVFRGFQLRSPGPDGTIGNIDDVSDPFARVVKPGTPYAKALQEDRIVDARYEMDVGDATVAAWELMFSELTGGVGGLGLSGIGEGGGARGQGRGQLGGGHGRVSFGIDQGAAFWAPPSRTDAAGRLHLHVPLGDFETTWRLALVALPDGGAPATAVVDIPVALPLSVHVETGASWIEGDEMDVAITVRNRTAHPLTATVTVAASGVAELAYTGVARSRATKPPAPLVVPADAMVETRIRIRASQPGTAHLDVRAQATGVPGDSVFHTWEVGAAGEHSTFCSSVWTDDRAELSLRLPPESIRIIGTPRLVLERGFDVALAGALQSLEADSLASPSALADAIEVAGRIRRRAIASGGETDSVAMRAEAIARSATGKLAEYANLDPASSSWSLARARAWAPASVAHLLGKATECPDNATTLEERLLALEGEPPPIGGSTKACWDALVSNAVDDVVRRGDPVDLALAVLALAERPHRAYLAGALADRLRERVSLQASGAISLVSTLASRRSARAIVFSSLLRSIQLRRAGTASAAKLSAWILVQRDTQGGYGSTEATRSVVRALLAEGVQRGEPSRVTVNVGGARRNVEVGPSAHLVIPLDPRTTNVGLEVKGQGVIARFERPILRLWSHPPDEASGGLRVEASWPTRARAGGTGVVRLSVWNALSRSLTADLRIPLPPGAALAEPIRGVRQVQGLLTVRRGVDASVLPTAIEIPVRFSLGGHLTVPEAIARVAFEEAAPTVIPARPLTIQP
jgi:hypothetical protein